MFPSSPLAGYDSEELAEILNQLNECKEKNRLRLANLKRMVKVFMTEVSRNKKQLPNYSATTMKELVTYCKEVLLQNWLTISVVYYKTCFIDIAGGKYIPRNTGSDAETSFACNSFTYVVRM